MFINTTTHTDPIIYHDNSSKSSPWWPRIVATRLSVTLPNDLMVITWTNRENTFLEDQLPITVLRRQGRWRHYNKFLLLDEALPSKYLLCVDSDDVVITDLTTIVERFNSYQCDVLFGAERVNYPLSETARQNRLRTRVEGPYCYLNAGVFMGRAPQMANFLRISRAVFWWDTLIASGDDQGAIVRLYEKMWPSVKIDHRCLIFQNLHTADNDICEF